MYRRMSCLYAIIIMLFVLAIPVGKMAEGATNPAPIDPSQATPWPTNSTCPGL